MKSNKLMKFLTYFTAVFCMAIILSSNVHNAYAAVTVYMGAEVKYSLLYPTSTYSTHAYTMLRDDGEYVTAYCIEANKGPLAEGDHEKVEISSAEYPLLLRVLCYGYRGPLDITGSLFGEGTEKQALRYLVTHIAASYAYNSVAMREDDDPNTNEDYTGIPNGAADFENVKIPGSDMSMGDFVRHVSTLPLNDGVATCASSGEGVQKVAYISYWELPANALTVKLNIHKKDAATDEYDVSVMGAEYTMYKRGTSADTLIETASVGAYLGENMTSPNIAGELPEGATMEARFKVKLGAGTYYVMETKAPDSGYWEIDKSQYEFVIKENASGNLYIEKDGASMSQGGIIRIEKVGKEDILHRESKKQAFPFALTKIDEITKETIQGAGFSVWRAEDIVNNRIGTTIPGYEYPKYDFDKAEPIVITSDGDKIMYTDENGYAQTIKLEPNLYVVKEVVTPSGYFDYSVERKNSYGNNQTYDYIEVDLKDNSNPVYHIGTLENMPKLFQLKVLKKDTDTKQSILSTNTTFNIFDIGKNKYLKHTIDGTETKDFKTDANGVLTVEEYLKPGKYRLEELTPPNKHYLLSEPIEIEVADDWDYASAPKDEMGVPIFEVDFFNQMVLGEIEITKIGDVLTDYKDGKFVWESKGLVGAEFEIYTDEVINHPITGEVVYEKDALVSKITSGENGIAKLEKMYLGKYYYKEVTTLPGYVLDENPVYFELEKADETEKLITMSKTMLNIRKKIELSVIKYNKGKKKVLSGAEFGLYANEDILNDAGEVIVVKGALIATATSNSEGVVNFEKYLPFSKYLVKELKAPKGYKLTKEEFEFGATLDDAKEVAYLPITLEIENEKKPGTPPEQPKNYYGNVSFSINNESWKRNYRTDDTGEDGYSIILDNATYEQNKPQTNSANAENTLMTVEPAAKTNNWPIVILAVLTGIVGIGFLGCVTVKLVKNKNE